MFIIAGIIHICGVIFYAIFASGELQPWAEPPKEVEQMQMQFQPPIQTQPIDPWAQNGSVTGLANYHQPSYGSTDSQQTSFYETRPQYIQQPATDRYLHGSVADREY